MYKGKWLLLAMIALVGVSLSHGAYADCILDDAAFQTGSGGCEDLSSGLVWSTQLTPGGQWNWSQSVTLCNNLVEGGESDWTLASIGELQTVYANGGTTHLDLWQASGGFWSSTRSKNKKEAWGINFATGVSTLANVNGYRFVICRR